MKTKLWRLLVIAFLLLFGVTAGSRAYAKNTKATAVKMTENEDVTGEDPAEKIDLSELTFDEDSFEGRLLSAGSFTLDIPAFESLNCVWSSADEKIATVTEDGTVTPLRGGWVNILVEVTDEDGQLYSYTIPIHILDPQFTLKKTNLAKGCRILLSVEQTSGASVVYKSSNTAVASVVASDSDANGVTVKAKKVGKATIRATVDGVTFSCQVKVTNPALKVGYGFYQKKKSFSISITGMNSDSSPVYEISDSAVAKVSKKGKVTTKKYGSAAITCLVDGKELTYYLAVSTKTAVAAMRWGYKKIGKCEYSQAKRMNKSYFDCSSFVYRCYRAAGRYLVSKSSWAPVAADIAKYYVKKNKSVKASSGKYSEKKLRPGDLICFGGKYAKKNGRYKRIYHIAIYIGNGKTLESSSTYNNVVIRDRGEFLKSDVPVVVRP